MKKLDVLETIIRIYDPSYTFKCLDEIFFLLKFVILKWILRYSIFTFFRKNE